MANGITAKTINPHPYVGSPIYTMPETDAEALAESRKKWRQAENERKVYKIENALTDGWVPSYNDPDNIGCHPNAEPRFLIGSIHEAEIINETTIRIL